MPEEIGPFHFLHARREQQGLGGFRTVSYPAGPVSDARFEQRTRRFLVPLALHHEFAAFLKPNVILLLPPTNRRRVPDGIRSRCSRKFFQRPATPVRPRSCIRSIWFTMLSYRRAMFRIPSSHCAPRNEGRESESSFENKPRPLAGPPGCSPGSNKCARSALAPHGDPMPSGVSKSCSSNACRTSVSLLATLDARLAGPTRSPAQTAISVETLGRARLLQLAPKLGIRPPR